MKRCLIIAITASFAFHSAVAEELKQLALDDASAVRPKITSDSEVKTEGKASLKIETSWPTTICLGEVKDLDIENARLVYQAELKSELAEGTAYLELWAHVGDGQYVSRGLENPITGRTDWRTAQTPFLFQAGQRPERVLLNLVINGKGTIWIDEITLSKTPL